ncbi:TolC family protein [Aquabacterium sp.]|uniref:TolC family protein n=1 Tax=Aquabacterium sp. TaxID=1872578 RepID=UPI003783E2B9
MLPSAFAVCRVARRRLACAALLALAVAWPGRLVQAAGCTDAPATPVAATADAQAARQALRTLTFSAIERNPGVAAARLLADAGLDDVREGEAAKRPQASLSVTTGPAAIHGAGVTESSANQLRAGLTVSQLLYDGGRTDRLIDVRRLQGEALRLSHLSQREQLALSAVSAAFELSRYRQQAQVYAEYRQSAACLVEALEQVVAADRGRLSELVQARKTLLQVELTQSQTDATVRQAALRLQRFVGEQSLGPGVLSGALLQLPSMNTLLAAAEHSAEVTQLEVQARAAEALTESIAAGNKPQLSWSAGLTQANNYGGNIPGSRSTGLSVGLNLNIPLLNPGTDAAAEAARKRAQAALLQRDDALEARRSRITDLYDQASSAFDRARQTEAILRDSERLRGFTLQQWQQLGRRSLFDVMAAESDHFSLRIAQVNALHDGQQLAATLQSLGPGLLDYLR